MATSLFLDSALLPDGWAEDVAVDVEGGVIQRLEVGARRDGRQRLAGIALPGLPNVHSHTFQRAMAGLAETRGPADDSFWTWREVMYRFLDSLTPDDVEAIATFAFMEMLEAGFTAVGEFHYLHHDPRGRPYDDPAELSARIVAAAAASGIGLTLLPSFYAHGGLGGAPPDPGQRRFVTDVPQFLRLLDRAGTALSALPHAMLGVAPHSLRAVVPEELRDLVAAVPAGPVHIHAAEQMREVSDCEAWSGRRPVEWLLDEFEVDARWCLVHATHMTAVETRRFAISGAVAGLCPLTEASLGDGIFAGADFFASGGRIGIGSDSNIELTAAGELKQLEYSQRLAHRARNVLARREGDSTGQRLYQSALEGGAQALGRTIGALAPGYRADIVVLDDSNPAFASMCGDQRLDAYIFVAGARAVRTVMVGGEIMVENGVHRDQARIRAAYATTLARIAQR